jgi:myosin I
MDIEFDFSGSPIGGCILSYLLEKSRVVHQETNERNFHIFYQLIMGADDALLDELGLERDLKKYKYLSNSDIDTTTQQDTINFENIKKSFDICNFTKEKQMVIKKLI